MTPVMLQFGSPWMLTLLALAPAAAVCWWWMWRARRLQQIALGADVSGGRAGSAASRALLLIALALIAVAAARPQWSEGEQTLSQSESSLVIALDVSQSMAAADVSNGAVSRFRAAQAEVRRLIDARRGDRVALVIFAGSAFLRFPLTRDHDAALQVLDAMQPGEALVRPGSNLADAIDLAALTIQRAADEDGAAAANGAIAVVSDGEVHDGDAPAAAAAARASGVQVFAFGVGSDVGATIASGPFGEPRIDPRTGQPVVTRLNAEHLQDIADAGGGRYVELDAPGRMASMTADLAALDLVRPVIVEETALAEQFQWFSGAAALLLVLASGARAFGASWRRPAWLALLVGAALGVGSCSGVSVEQLNRDGVAHYDAGEYDAALVDWREAQRISRARGEPIEPRLHLNAGRALHQLGAYERAEADTLAALRSDKAAVRATAWFHAGNHRWANDDLLGARQAYIEALRESPSLLDAKVNLEIVTGMLDALQADASPAQRNQPPPDESGQSAEAGQGSLGLSGESSSAAGGADEASQDSQSVEASQSDAGMGGEDRGLDAGGLPTAPTFEEESIAARRETARAELREALEELPLEYATLEQALAVLDALRAVPGERLAAGTLSDTERALDW